MARRAPAKNTAPRAAPRLGWHDHLRALLTSEAHFEAFQTRGVYVEGPAKYSTWANYLETFDEVVVLARVAEGASPASEEARADGSGVSFCALPDYHGPWGYLRRLPELKRRAREAIRNCDAYVLRVPGLVGRLVWRELAKTGKPYALEIVGDPWDALGPGTVRTALRPVLRRAAASELRTMCRGAIAIHYVTQRALQQRYPPAKGVYAVGFSDALMDSAFASQADIERRWERIDDAIGKSADRPLRVGFVGSLSQLYKGPEVLLRAVAECASRGLSIEALLAGDGRYLPAMKSLAAELGIGAHTQFLGQLPFGQSVLEFLDSVDLFVMPSYAEGLPRALLEAMARGCPCIGSNVGGIPELLRPEDMVPARDAHALAAKLLESARSPDELKRMSQRNLEKAREFNPEALRQIRRAFYEFVKLHSVARS